MYNKILAKDEKILWEGAPNKSRYMFTSIFACIVIVLIVFIAYTFFGNVEFKEELADGTLSNDAVILKESLAFIIAAIALPTLAFLNILKCALELRNIKYVVTQNRAIIQKGIIGIDHRTIAHTKTEDVRVEVGIIDKFFGTGNIVLVNETETQISSENGNTTATTRKKVDITNSFMSVNCPYDVMKIFSEISHNVRTDTYYPNELRPQNNSEQ